MAIPISDNIRSNSNKPLDYKFGPFISVAQANSIIPIEQRHNGLIFGIYETPGDIPNSKVEYYKYKNGLTDTDIEPVILKDEPGGVSANDTSILSLSNVSQLSTTARRSRSRAFVNGGGQGGSMFTYINSGSGLIADGGIHYNAQDGGLWKREFDGAIDIRWFGVEQNDISKNVINKTLIQKCFDSSPLYSEILIPEGVTYVSDQLIPREGQKIYFKGWLKLKDVGTPIKKLISLQNRYIELHNPMIDFDGENNSDDLLPGTEAVISNYGNGYFCKIYGGIVKNGIDNLFQGGRDGLIIDGTVFENCGEHAFYINGIDGGLNGGNPRNITIKNVRITDVAQNSTHITEGHCFQIKNCDNIEIQNVYFDSGTPAIPTFYFLLEDVHGLHSINCIGKGLNHRVIYAGQYLSGASCSDLLFEGLDVQRVSGLGSAASFAISSTVKNCQIKNSIFRNIIFAGEMPEVFDNCEFIGLAGKITSVNPLVIKNSKIENSAPTLAQFTNKIILDTVEWSGTGGTTTGIEISPTDTTITCEIINNTFKSDFTYPIWINKGHAHKIIGNKFPVSTYAKKIEIKDTVTGQCIVKRNSIPNYNVASINDLTKKAKVDENDGVYWGRKIKSIAATSYTLQLEDSDLFLYFTSPATVVTIPTIFYFENKIRGGVANGADVTFSFPSGNLRKPSGVPLILPANSTFSLKFIDRFNAIFDLNYNAISEASTNSATDVGATYSQAEVQAILTELRDLKTKMRAAGLLAT